MEKNLSEVFGFYMKEQDRVFKWTLGAGSLAMAYIATIVTILSLNPTSPSTLRIVGMLVQMILFLYLFRIFIKHYSEVSDVLNELATNDSDTIYVKYGRGSGLVDLLNTFRKSTRNLQAGLVTLEILSIFIVINAALSFFS